jgi:hypothetical protein
MVCAQCVETFTEYPPLGRFAVRDMRQVRGLPGCSHTACKSVLKSGTFSPMRDLKAANYENKTVDCVLCQIFCAFDTLRQDDFAAMEG